jgi:MFS transporter, BCD family, chlorophyll transporter
MTRAEREAPKPLFADAWRDFASGGQAGRLLAVVACGTLAFNMQDVLLEPYGGEILGLSVVGHHAADRRSGRWARWRAFALAARWLARGLDPYRMAARGHPRRGRRVHFSVIFAAPLASPPLFFAWVPAGSASARGLFPSPR